MRTTVSVHETAEMPAPAPARTARVRRARRPKSRVALGASAVLVVLLALLTTGSADGTYALWYDRATQPPIVMQAASIKAVSALDTPPTVTFSAGLTEKTGGLTITNAGTIDAAYTTTTTATGSTQLTQGITVDVWKSTITQGCSTPISPVRGTWAAFPVLTGTLAAGASQFYCLKTTLTTAVGITSDTSMTATFNTVLQRSNWTSPASSSVTQSFVDASPKAPTSLSFSGTTSTSTTLNWSGATDDVGVTGYDIYRDTTLIGSTTGATSFIITGLAASTAYSYTVVAKDGAAHVSPASPKATVTTLAVGAPSGWFQIVNSTSQLCIDATGAGTVNFTALIQYACSNPAAANQQWSFSGPNADGYYTVVPKHSNAIIWDVEAASSNNATRIILYAPNLGTNQQWSVIAVGGDKYQFVARNSGKCMSVIGGVATSGAGFEQVTCNPNDPAQTFTLKNVGATNARMSTPEHVVTQLTCESSASPSWMATYRWTPPTGVDPATLKYNLYVNGVKIANTADGWNPYVQLTNATVPSSIPLGRSPVSVQRIMPDGSETAVGAGIVDIQRYQTTTDRTFACG
ncbi:RICIN domain-containing protein [Mycetocola zhadangensis]|nr:RICIN domain-containing protein [Mycetocola zhadangensis]